METTLQCYFVKGGYVNYTVKNQSKNEINLQEEKEEEIKGNESHVNVAPKINTELIVNALLSLQSSMIYSIV